jgi:hypothetical protein
LDTCVESVTTLTNAWKLFQETHSQVFFKKLESFEKSIEKNNNSLEVFYYRTHFTYQVSLYRIYHDYEKNVNFFVMIQL